MRTFGRAAAAASAASAATTLVLIFAPSFFAPAPDFAGRMGRVADPAYQFRAWVQLVHPLLVFAAALGVTLALRARALAWAGLSGFALWAAVELAQQCLTLFAFDRWRRAWLAGDPAVRATMELRTAVYDGLWDAAYVLLLIGFLIGNGCFGGAMARTAGLTRAVGIFLLLAAALTLALLSAEVGGPALPEPLAFWLYPAIQPAGRLLLGAWLWRAASGGRTKAGGRADPRYMAAP